MYRRETERYAKFSLGRLYITRGALDEITPDDLLVSIIRHATGDWGELCKEDWKANEMALTDGSRLFSVYRTKAGVKFYIITEWDRSCTTVLLPSEY